ncbi:PadR family transcriptional regulator [Isoptericola dokdonensis]|uniref:Transcriptional regulator YqjI n=1 Tax=Isoptericola dokdonensis DS-3 TaxID=1300344 RepID=A0A161IF11_9MICO|nr:PadR family transcriptional regulator [Isoptericola dokdonensis]ANC32231.1 Transcriptional regulator YqjI [Isoptericola dokdonensis DS-3]
MRTPNSTPFTDPFDLPHAERRRGDHPRGGRGRRGGFDAGWESGPRGPRPGGFGPGGPGGRGPRRGRGQMRAAILLLLDEEPRHGYQIITELAERSQGAWRPSPGAVYPAIAQLQDEGLVTLSDDEGRRLATLTDTGRAHVAEHRDELGTPWEGGPRHRGHEVHRALRDLHGAVEQVARTGTPEQGASAVEILDKARRDLYLLLAG